MIAVQLLYRTARRALFVILFSSGLVQLNAAAALTVTDLRVDHRVAPVGIDTPAPRFSWRLHGAAAGLRQSAYRLQVARQVDALGALVLPLVWDSTWAASEQSDLVAYAGPALASSTAYYWRVQVKDGDGAETPWSTPARWITGFLNADQEFQADWIGFDQVPPSTPQGAGWFALDQAQWIIHPKQQNNTETVAYYRSSFTLPTDTTRVMIAMELNYTGQVFFNGMEILQGGWHGIASYLDVTPWMRPGRNRLAARVNASSHDVHEGFLLAVHVEHRDGRVTRQFTDASWESSLTAVDLWRDQGQAGAPWESVRVLGKPGEPNPTGQGQPALFNPQCDSTTFSPPAVYLRKDIKLTKPIRYAVFHGTAQGLYDLHVNGQRMTPSGFQPGWTQFDRRISYVSTDVTQALQIGNNTLGAVLADGYFRGNLIWVGREKFGKQTRFSGQLEIEYQDGSRASFRTDPTWKAAHGPVQQADIMNGEIYDARLEQPGWDKPGFEDGAWSPVTTSVRGNSEELKDGQIVVTEKIRQLIAASAPIVASNGLVGPDPTPGIQKALKVTYMSGGKSQCVTIDEPQTWTLPPGVQSADIVRAIYGNCRSKANFIQRAHPTDTVRPEIELPAKSITEPKPGVYVVDFGQNFSGWTRLQVRGAAGQVIYLRFAEDLNADGTIYTDNLRSVNPSDRYICKGGGTETWEPRFTYHGFRYVQILGLKSMPSKDTLTGIVAHSGGPITSNFACSSPMLNRLYKNVQWSQRSNYFETMTDCPQRDERLGWVGDAHFFMRSSAYNQTAADFFNKWFLDCLDTQGANGNIRDGAPGYSPGAGSAHLDWTAAVMVTPWTIWNYYGDRQPIDDHYDQLKRYMGMWQQFAADISPAPGEKEGPEASHLVGDWVALQSTPIPLIGRLYCHLLSQQMVEFARMTGHDEDVLTFTALAERFRKEVISKHIAPDGTVSGDSQTGYALVIRFKCYEPAQEALLREKFRQRMEADHYGVKTGFHGTGNLLQALCDIGLTAEAGKTVLNEAYPGWGSMVKLGATTIWERWAGKTAAGTFFNPSMNSFNHYTFGGCGEWLMGYLVGLRPAAPGFKIVKVEPVVIPDLEWAAGSFVSPYGTVVNRWERKNGQITMRLQIPPNSSALVVLPAQAKIPTLAGQKLTSRPPAGVPVGSGSHIFTWQE